MSIYNYVIKLMNITPLVVTLYLCVASISAVEITVYEFPNHTGSSKLDSISGLVQNVFIEYLTDWKQRNIMLKVL